MGTSNDGDIYLSPTAFREMVKKGVHAALRAEGYIDQFGKRQYDELDEKLFELVTTVIVHAKRERAGVAERRENAMKVAFPNVPGPGEWEDTDNPELAEAVYKALLKIVWMRLRNDPSGPVQQMVGYVLGNGHVLCHVKVGQATLVYVTDDDACIMADYVGPDNLAVERLIGMKTERREMLMMRRPEYAKRYKRDFEKTLKGALTTGRSQLQLALEAAGVNGSDEDEESDDEQEATV